MTQNNDQDDRAKDESAEEAPETQSSTAPKASADTAAAEDEDDKAQSQRKERVLHTRVPAVLEQELKRLATSLRMPVSNVVRAILEDAVTAVDVVGRKAEGEMNRVVDRMAEKRERLRDIATGPKSKPVESDVPKEEPPAAKQSAEPKSGGKEQLAGVIGFQPLLLAASASCSVCGVALKAGSEAYVGVRDVPGPRVLIGPECLPKPEDEG